MINHLEWWAERYGMGDPIPLFPNPPHVWGLLWGLGTENPTGLLVDNDLGHAWPGGTHGHVCQCDDWPAGMQWYCHWVCDLWQSIVGPLSDWITNEEMWAFLEAHSLP